MASGYTKAALLQKLDTAAQDIATFYQHGFINYRGRTTDTGELYTEVIAAWCLADLPRFAAIPRLRRKAGYKTATHDGQTPRAESNREEERIAMAMFRQGTLPCVGKVLDYQTPLKNRRTDRAGKIDLLAFDGHVLRILELKAPDSTETMLRCVLEGHTYLQTVDAEKLLADFSLPPDTPLKACPFVFYGSVQWQEMQEERPCLKHLMAQLDSRPFYIREIQNRYTVEE